MIRLSFIFMALTYFFVRTSFAGEALIFGIHNQYMSTRALGMGNAHVAVADDSHALFFNPAGLPQVRDGEMDFFLRAGVNPDIKKLADDIDKAGSNASAIANVLDANYGNHYSLRGPSLGWLWARPKWSIAFIPADLSVDVEINENVGPALNLVAYQDSTLAFARAWNIPQIDYGRFDMGVTAKLIYRAHLDKIISIAAIQNDKILEAENSNEGLTLDFDIGAMWHMPEYDSGFLHYLQPTFGMTIRNVLDYGYLTNFGLFDKSKTGDPDKLRRSLDVGAAFALPEWWVWTSRLAVDVKNIAHPNWTPKKGYHIGAEFLWKMASWWKGGWRLGLNQGYYTAGFTGQLSVFKLDLATYGEEVGTKSKSKENRVYMLTMSLDF